MNSNCIGDKGITVSVIGLISVPCIFKNPAVQSFWSNINERMKTFNVHMFHLIVKLKRFNPYVTNGISHTYHLDESTFVFRASEVIFVFIAFFDEIYVSKQNSPRWDAGFCSVTSGVILFVYVP